MGLLQDIYKRFDGSKDVIDNYENKTDLKKRPDKAYFQKIIQEQAQFRTNQDIQRWRNALLSAENYVNPRRVELYRLYKDVTLDGHLTSMISSRKFKVLSKAFEFVNEKGDIDEEITALFRKPWFRRFCDLALDSLFWGHSLINFGDISENGFESIDLVPRWYVMPEKDLLLKSVGDVTGINFKDSDISPWFLGIGDPYDLGLLMKASPYVIYKKYVVQAWSRSAELFGMPFRVGKFDGTDALQRNNLMSALQNMGQAGFALIDSDTDIEIKPSNSSDAHRVYLEMANLCNAELSKLIQGQTMTSDNGSSRSQAEVHEKVADEYGVADMIFIENTVNWMLRQKMEDLGIDLKGCIFRYSNKDDEQASIKRQIENNTAIATTIKNLSDSGYQVDPKWLEENTLIKILGYEKLESQQSTENKYLYQELKNYYPNE